MKRLSLAEMRTLQNDQLGFALKVAQELGGVAHLKLLWFDMFLVTEPAIIRELLIQHGSRMQRDRFTSQMFKRFMGNGICGRGEGVAATAPTGSARLSRHAHSGLRRHDGHLHARNDGPLTAGTNGGH